jgi:3-dehydroquinate synthase
MASILTVQLGDRSYPIHIGPDLLASLGDLCKGQGLGPSCLLVTDESVDALYGDRCEQSLRAAGFRSTRAVLPPGESTKSMASLARLFDAAVTGGLERSSFIVALGGGVIGDLAGFAAATYLRGIRLVQIPTTLLAMVDSAVGGKTGINLPQGKNLVGSFHQPSLVLADLSTLRSLPPREGAAGLAEVVKYGVIADPEIWNWLEAAGDAATVLSDEALLGKLVRRSCEIKADVVRQDEREGGLRAILNFGHTFGHALEQVTGYTRYLHGEAVSLGMLYAARVSMRLTGFSGDDTRRMERLLRALQLPVEFPDLPWAELRTAMGRDKKSTSGAVRFVLAERPGVVRFGCPVEDAVLEEVWHGCR